MLRGPPAIVRSDNGPEFGAKSGYIEPGSPWENGHIESFSAGFQYGLLDGEIFDSFKEAQAVIEQWRRR